MSEQPTDDRWGETTDGQSGSTATDGPEESTATDESSVDRRAILRLAGGAAAAGAAGIGAFAGSAAAWDRFDVDFKGCSEVWMIVGEKDLRYDPPTTAKVVVASDGEPVCRLVEFTEETATTVPGQYGDAPLVKFTVGSDEKVLGVISYNYPYEGDGRFSRPRCLMVNDHRCANSPGTPDPFDAPCADGLSECWWEPVGQRGGGNGGGNGNGNGNGGGNGNGNGNGNGGGNGNGNGNSGGGGNGNGNRNVNPGVGHW
jgi:hypothetical protein